MTGMPRAPSRRRKPRPAVPAVPAVPIMPALPPPRAGRPSTDGTKRRRTRIRDMADVPADAAGAHAAPAPASGHGPKHPYHLVDPSPWPLAGAFSAGLMATGGVVFMHGGGYWLLILGFLCVLAVMALWWRDVLTEAVRQHAHTPVVKLGLRYGMALFIASEVMFFAAFFWAFFDASLFPREAIGGVWTPKNIHTVDPFEMPLMMTLILLLSGTTVTWAHHALQVGNRKETLVALGATILLGVSFSFFQGYEYAHAEFG